MRQIKSGVREFMSPQTGASLNYAGQLPSDVAQEYDQTTKLGITYL